MVIRKLLFQLICRESTMKFISLAYFGQALIMPSPLPKIPMIVYKVFVLVFLRVFYRT